MKSKPTQLLRDCEVNVIPCVSILIPTYNRALFLPDAIKSALSQTYKNIEIIVLDDASPDNTPEVMVEFLDNPKLRYICHAENLGIGGNWRSGINAKQGDFFCILHDDDTFEPTFLEALIQPLLDDPQAVLSFCDHWMMDCNGIRSLTDSDVCSRRFKRNALAEGALSDFAHAALVDAAPPIGATLFRSSMISPEFIHENAKGSIDAWLFYQCVRTGQCAYYVPQRLMNYRVHQGGMSSSMPLYMAEGHIFRYRQILNDPSLKAIHADIHMKMAQSLTDASINQLVQGNHKQARQSAEEAQSYSFSRRAQSICFLASLGIAGTYITRAVKFLLKIRTSTASIG